MKSIDSNDIRRPKRGPTMLGVALVTLGLAALLAVACNGGGNGESTPTAQPTGVGSATAQPTGQATMSAACQALASLKSYHFVSNITLESPEETVTEPTPIATLTREFTGPFRFEYNIDGSLVAPDRVDAFISSGEGNPFQVIIIGNQSWLSIGGQWQQGGTQATVPYKPIDVCNAVFPELNLDQAQGQKDTVNDVSALHHTFSATPTGQTFVTMFGGGSDMAILLRDMNVEVWLAEDEGWPVRMDIQSTGLYADGRPLIAHVRVELKDINDKDIKVEPPI